MLPIVLSNRGIQKAILALTIFLISPISFCQDYVIEWGEQYASGVNSSFKFIVGKTDKSYFSYEAFQHKTFIRVFDLQTNRLTKVYEESEKHNSFDIVLSFDGTSYYIIKSERDANQFITSITIDKFGADNNLLVSFEVPIRDGQIKIVKIMNLFGSDLILYKENKPDQTVFYYSEMTNEGLSDMKKMVAIPQEKARLNCEKGMLFTGTQGISVYSDRMKYQTVFGKLCVPCKSSSGLNFVSETKLGKTKIAYSSYEVDESFSSIEEKIIEVEKSFTIRSGKSAEDDKLFVYGWDNSGYQERANCFITDQKGQPLMIEVEFDFKVLTRGEKITKVGSHYLFTGFYEAQKVSSEHPIGTFCFKLDLNGNILDKLYNPIPTTISSEVEKVHGTIPNIRRGDEYVVGPMIHDKSGGKLKFIVERVAPNNRDPNNTFYRSRSLYVVSYNYDGTHDFTSVIPRNAAEEKDEQNRGYIWGVQNDNVFLIYNGNLTNKKGVFVSKILASGEIISTELNSDKVNIADSGLWKDGTLVLSKKSGAKAFAYGSCKLW